MRSNNNPINKKVYTHLSHSERELIFKYFSIGYSLGQIANRIHRAKSTIAREFQRNTPHIRKGYYRPHKAQARYTERFSISHKRQRLKNNHIREYVETHLKNSWSPELIAGRIKYLFREQKISYEAIYQYIYIEKPEFIGYLCRAHRKRKYRGQSKRHKTSHIPNRIPISQRPSKINNRKEFGHWEADTAISRQSKESLAVMTERKSRLTLIKKLKRKSSRQMSNALKQRLSKFPKKGRRSITYDNGTENTEHERTNKLLNTKSYFTAPFHSWEKGSVENAIGILRIFLPKKTDFAKVSNGQIKDLEQWINNRPRKCLNFQTPLEVFQNLVALAP